MVLYAQSIIAIIHFEGRHLSIQTHFMNQCVQNMYCTNLSLSNTTSGTPHAIKSADALFERASGFVVHALRTMVMPGWYQGWGELQGSKGCGRQESELGMGHGCKSDISGKINRFLFQLRFSLVSFMFIISGDIKCLAFRYWGEPQKTFLATTSDGY